MAGAVQAFNPESTFVINDMQQVQVLPPHLEHV